MKKIIIIFVSFFLIFIGNIANAWVPLAYYLLTANVGATVVISNSIHNNTLMYKRLESLSYSDTTHEKLNKSIHARLNLHFLVGSTRIETEYSKNILDSFGKVVKKYQDDTGDSIKILVYGFTDNKGGKKENIKISKKRSEYVKKYLIENYEFQNSNIKVKGFGDKYPLASNKTIEGRKNNRRVELQMLKFKHIEE
jgi:outer membrane protein OmpA-like peptidoglycan-associated protein